MYYSLPKKLVILLETSYVVKCVFFYISLTCVYIFIYDIYDISIPPFGTFSFYFFGANGRH